MYSKAYASHVPPGWDRWFAFTSPLATPLIGTPGEAGWPPRSSAPPPTSPPRTPTVSPPRGRHLHHQSGLPEQACQLCALNTFDGIAFYPFLPLPVSDEGHSVDYLLPPPHVYYSDYYNYSVSDQGHSVDYGDNETDYSTGGCVGEVGALVWGGASTAQTARATTAQVGGRAGGPRRRACWRPTLVQHSQHPCPTWLAACLPVRCPGCACARSLRSALPWLSGGGLLPRRLAVLAAWGVCCPGGWL